MSCKKLSERARREQSYWLSWVPEQSVTERQRLEFLRYDSHGGTIDQTNPVLAGKAMHGHTGSVLVAARLAGDADWVGGIWLIAHYIRRPFGLRPLREWFSADIIDGWCDAYYDAIDGRLLNPNETYEQRGLWPLNARLLL